MLEALGRLYAQKGLLSGIIIDECEAMPSSSVYRARFGSLLRAYSLVGFTPAHDYRFVRINRALRALHPTIVQSVRQGFELGGSMVSETDAPPHLIVNQHFTSPFAERTG
jgi:hypothetical protein